MSRTLSPYQIDVAISHLSIRKNILLKVYDGVKEMDGQEERSNFLKREIGDIEDVINVLKG